MKKPILKEKTNLQIKEKIGVGVFVIGMLIAILISGATLTANQNDIIKISLAIFGIVVGFLNIRDVEIDKFLVSSISIIVLTYVISDVFQDLPVIGYVLLNMYHNFVSFVGPAALVVTVKVILNVASER